MRIKNFTLLTLALFLMSVVAFAQNPTSTKHVLTPKQQVLQAKRTGELTKENASAFKFAKPALPQNMKRAKAKKPVASFNFKKIDANAVAQVKAKKAAKKASKRFTMSPRKMDVRECVSMTSSAKPRSRRAATTDEHGIITEPGEGTVKVYKVAGSGYDYGDLVGLSGTTKIVESTDGFVYIQNIVTYYTRGTWVKGTKSGNTITVPTKQPLYYSSSYDATVSARWGKVEGTSVLPADETAENFTFTVDETAQTISLNGTSEALMISAIWDDDNTWTGYSVWETVYTYDHDFVAPTIVTVMPPVGLETTTWYTKGHTYSSNGTSSFKGTVTLGFDGNDVYVQGIFSDFPEAWVKGTIDGTTVTFKDLQLQGEAYGYAIYAVGTDGSELTDFVMTYDAEKGVFTSENELLANAADDKIYYLTWITDIEINKEAPGDERVTPPAGLVTEDWTVARYFYDGEDETGEEKVIQIGFDGKDVYVQGFSYYSDYMEEPNWIKGTLSEDGKSITFPGNQYYGIYNDTNEFYFAGIDMNTFELASTITVEYDAEAGTMTWPEDILLVENGAEDDSSLYGYFTEIVATVRGTAPDPLAAPDVITTEWYFKSQSLGTDQETGETVAEDYNLHVQVAVVGTDVFVKGLCEDIPDAWIKGTLDPATNKVTFPTGQYFGQDAVLWFVFDYFFAGYGQNGFEDVVMDYDATAKTLTMASPSYLLINAAWLLLDPNLILTDVTLQEIQDVAATPAQPEIVASKLSGTSYPNITVEVPDTDTEGNPLLVDKLSYQYWYEVDGTQSLLTLDPAEYTELTEPMTEIPYSFSDDWDIYPYRLYLNQDFSDWKKIGIQSIYRGGGQEKKSEVSWKTISNISVDPNFDSTHGGISVTTKALEGETVSVTVKSLDTYVIVKVTARAGNTDLQVTDDGDGAYSFVAPAADVVVNAEFQAPPADFELAVEPGNISDALDAQITEDVTVRNVTLTLSEGNYTITKPIEAAGNVTITGAGENTVIDASALDGPFVLMSANPIPVTNEAGGIPIGNIIFKNLVVKDLAQQLVYANKQKYLFDNVEVNNCIIGIKGASKKTIFDFNGGGNTKKLTVVNSTLWADASTQWQNGGFYSSQSGQDVVSLGGESQLTSIKNSNFYNIANGKTTSTRRKNSQKWMTYEVKNSIIVNSGKKGEFYAGLNGGNANGGVWDIDNNSVRFNDEDVNEAEASKAKLTGVTAIEGDPGFKDAENGDFHIGEVSYSDQAKARIGDPRWLTVYKPETVTAPIELTPLDGADLAADVEEAYKEQGLAPAYITINLLPGGHYTVSKPMEINATINIIGDEANPATIDLNDCSGAMVQYSSTLLPAFTVNNLGFYEQPFNVVFKNVIFSRVKNQLFYANKQKYLVEYFTFENCLAEYLGGSKTIFDFNGGGVVENLTINNSTIYGNSNDGMKHEGALFSSQSGNKVIDAGPDKIQTFTITNSTLYNIANGKNVMTHRQNSQIYLTYVVKNNVIFNCGKKGQFCQGLNGGGNSANPMYYVHYNSFMWYADGVLADVDDTCGDKNPNVVTASWKNTYPESAVTDVFPKFFGTDEIGQYNNFFRGNFTVADGSVQKTNSVGDPRWLKSDNEYTDIQGISADKMMEGAWYTIQGVRVDQPTKGLYIHNGKKVVLK